MPKTLVGRRDATTHLGVSLNTDAKSLNNSAKLLTLLRPGHDSASTRTAIIALERFFSERLCRGDLRGGSGDAAAATDAAAIKYQEWFQKHYKLFTKRLTALLSGVGFEARKAGVDAQGEEAAAAGGGDGGGRVAVEPKTQVLALAAVMECARSEHPGRFNNELYAAALTAALRGTGFTPELLGALASRYLTKMDVRYHTYATIAKIANEVRRSGGVGGGAGTESSTHEGGGGMDGGGE
eukprot:CAMPEP_0198697918 /NCGR_PEP_ID=MMETSP1468-20131203/329746_1 /TAXON_ID=1461545 /ORGANISM="Mantoniella sp, Strain CCMP1436" /LENGTH=238 /DNA_ID=CAMNT_0044454733 /DNA_START=46 /DNA_END=759 /DNA_ORIENTATION=+